jgi:tetratricopeptide (TPR) repeat protein
MRAAARASCVKHAFGMTKPRAADAARPASEGGEGETFVRSVLGMRRLALLLPLLAAAPAAAVLPEPPGDPQVAEGVRMLEGGRYELGLPLLEAALARLPGDPDILVYIAFAHRRAGRTDPAMEAYAQALSRDPNHPGALAYQGALFLELGRRAEAEANLARLRASCAGCPETDTLAPQA